MTRYETVITVGAIATKQTILCKVVHWSDRSPGAMQWRLSDTAFEPMQWKPMSERILCLMRCHGLIPVCVCRCIFPTGFSHRESGARRECSNNPSAARGIFAALSSKLQWTVLRNWTNHYMLLFPALFAGFRALVVVVDEKPGEIPICLNLS